MTVSSRKTTDNHVLLMIQIEAFKQKKKKKKRFLENLYPHYELKSFSILEDFSDEFNGDMNKCDFKNTL